MSTVVYLPVSKKDPTRARIGKPQEPQTKVSYSQLARIAHDLKNCMTVLLLGSVSLGGYADRTISSRSRRQTFEKVIGDMDRSVDELVRLVESGSALDRKSTSDNSGSRARLPKQSLSIQCRR
jgi:hypothetical protein